MTINRRAYLAGEVDFDTYYLAVADAIGREPLARIVRQIVPIDVLRVRLAADPHLNNIPLGGWDRRDAEVRHLVSRNGLAVMAVSWNGHLTPNTICWSVSDSVCVLKAAARALVAA